MVENRGGNSRLSNLPLKKILPVVLVLSIVITSILIIGLQPVHRTTIEHSDIENDVSDSNIDIISIRSYLNESDIILQMTVLGTILNSTADSNYEYRLIIVARGVIDDRSHIYTCYYDNGTTWPYDFQATPENNTLVIVFPLTIFLSDSYMIGLEGIATVSGNDGVERDQTEEDRNEIVARLLF